MIGFYTKIQLRFKDKNQSY